MVDEYLYRPLRRPDLLAAGCSPGAYLACMLIALIAVLALVAAMT